MFLQAGSPFCGRDARRTAGGTPALLKAVLHADGFMTPS